MAADRMQRVRRAVLGGFAFVMMLNAPSWAQSKPGHDSAASAPAISTAARSPRSLATLLNDTDAIVRGVISRRAAVRTDAGAVLYRDYNVHSPVVVFQRTDSTLGLHPGPSWRQAMRVRVVIRAVSRDEGAAGYAYPARVLGECQQI